MRAPLLAVALAVALVAAPPVQAGRSCEVRKLSAQSIGQGMDLAARTAAALDASGSQVVVLARAGQDLRKHGLNHSHLGFAYRTEEGTWRVLHKLNQCGTAHAGLWRQGLGEFFMDVWRHEAAWVVPTREVQERLLPVLRDNTRAARLHERSYSVVSYAWGQKYQQSNQWALETLAAAMEPAADSRDRAQAWLRLKGYEPTTLRLGPLTRLGGRVGSANVAFDDHPDAKRFSDRIETVTVESMFTWLQRSGLASAPQVLR